MLGIKLKSSRGNNKSRGIGDNSGGSGNSSGSNNSGERSINREFAKRVWAVLLTVFVLLGALGIVVAVYPSFCRQAEAGLVDITEDIMESAENDGTYSYDGYYDSYMADIGDRVVLYQNHWQILNQIAWLMLGILFYTALAAFIIALIKPLGITNRMLFRAPLEVVLIIGVTCIMLVAGDGPYSLLVELTWGLANRELPSALMQEFYISAAQAEVIMTALTLLAWFIFSFVIYWTVTCLTAVFTIGPVTYMKERTLTGRLLRWIRRIFKETYNLVENVDFKDKSSKAILKVVGLNFILLTVISCFWFFGIFGLIGYSVVLFFILRKNYFAMQENYQVLLKATNELAEGNLDVEIREDLGVFEPFREEIGKIQSGFKKAVEEEVKSQSMKTELITNVSHDLKTPLTAIITYVDLLKKEDITEEERGSYIKVLEQKSMRLKHLIEDLFEVSKANSKNVTLSLVDVDIVSLMKQVRLELEDKVGEANLEFKWNLPEQKIVLNLDSEKTYRVFENLLINIIKYAMPGTRAYIDIEDREKEVAVSFKNISAAEISLNGSELSERFVRGDVSRNTEGSGLGLAIAKSFVELQRGVFEVEIEADLFKVLLVWRKEDDLKPENM